jgi:hypothetical protein
VIAEKEWERLLPKRVAIVEVTLVDGTRLREYNDTVRGTPENPMSGPRLYKRLAQPDIFPKFMGADIGGIDATHGVSRDPRGSEPSMALPKAMSANRWLHDRTGWRVDDCAVKLFHDILRCRDDCDGVWQIDRYPALASFRPHDVSSVCAVRRWTNLDRSLSWINVTSPSH